MEHFEDLLNPAYTSSWQQAGPKDLSISLAGVTEVAKKLLSSKVPGVDGICPEILKALNIVGLSCLTHLCSVTRKSRKVPAEWRSGVVVPIFKKGDRRVCSNRRGVTLLSPLGKVYSRVLEWRLRQIVEPQLQKQWCQ